MSGLVRDYDSVYITLDIITRHICSQIVEVY